jgi:hypothetical protein
MLQRTECELLLVENFDWARAVMTRQCKRYRMAPDDSDDFESWAFLRLVENDYRILRQFRGDSALRTYLTVVICTLHREFIVQHWGRYRPSSIARRAGDVGLELDRLIRRDRYSAAEATQCILARHQEAPSAEELMRLALSLPSRYVSGRERKVELRDDTAAASSADERIAFVEACQQKTDIRRALARVAYDFSTFDIAMLRMRFQDETSVADIARELGVAQKPLYRVLERLLRTMRARLEDCGITRHMVVELLEEYAA